MIPVFIEGATRTLGAPDGWDKEKHGPCSGLPIRDEPIAGGMPAMTSAWLPTAEEVARIRAGAPVMLRVVGSAHPPVAVFVGQVPA